MVQIVAKTAASVAANTKSSDQVDGQYQFISKGNVSLYALPSATGMNCTLTVNGVPIIDDQALPMFGTSGAMSKIDNLVTQQAVAGGRVQLFFRNTTGGALTVDYILEFEPTK